MWAKINKDVSSVSDNINNQVSNNVTSLKELMQEFKEVVVLEGPGLLINVHQKTKSLYPTNFTGINLIANKNIGEYGVYNFNINLDPTVSQYYSPFNSYLSREMRKYSDQTNQTGFSNIAFKQDLTNELKLSICGYVQHVKTGTAECVLDYIGNKFTSSLSTSYSEDSKAEFVMQHLQEIKKNICIGAEISMQTTNASSIDSKRLAFVGRYTDQSIGVVSATVGLQGMQICLFKQINSQLKVGSTMDVCFEKRSVTGSIGCELADKEFTMRASLDTNGCVIANLIKNHFYRNGNVIFKPTVSILCNVQKQMKLGVGFELAV